MHINSVQQNSKTLLGVQGTALCLLDLGGLEVSSRGSLNISANIGWYFLNMTIETEKLASSLSILARKSCGIFAISAHDLLFVKNCISGRLHSCKRRVSDTQLPSTLVPGLPTVGIENFLQATYTAQPTQCNWSPCKYILEILCKINTSHICVKYIKISSGNKIKKQYYL